MKITLYLDVYPGMDFDRAYANASPGSKGSAKRYAIEVVIPDPNNPDERINAQNVREVDND